MTFQIINLFIIQLLLPIFLLIWLWKGRYKTKFDWFLQFLFTGVYILFIFLTGRWDWISYYFRFVLGLFFLLGTFYSYLKSKKQPLFLKKDLKDWSLTSIVLVLTLIFGELGFLSIKGYFFRDKNIELSFPLKNGVYYVAHGGSTPIINYHNSYPPQKYALDIVKLNKLGIRAMGIYPQELKRYEIYGDTIYSPCDGKIIKAVDSLPDMIPPNMDKENPKGNYVAIDYKGVTIYIAHMLKGTSLVEEGDTVIIGQPLGRVGNSGNTSEPHLHIHTERHGQGVPITFNNRFLKRNSLVFIK